MSRPFVHLHNHTEYSLLDGATRVKDMVKRAKELEMPAIAITDHGVMFGCMEFYFECKKQGVKPILGMEAYVCADRHKKERGGEEKELFHLLLLARNLEGYRNLCKLHTAAALEGFYYKPRIDFDLLKRHSGGLISSTTCLGSEVNQLLIKGDYDRAQRLAGQYKEIFDDGCYFVELQDHGIPEQHRANEGLVRIAHELKLPLVCTNDAHYLCKEDADPHDVLLCIGTGAQQEDSKRFKFPGDAFYVKSSEEMEGLFPEHPQACANTLAFADMVEDYELGSSRAIMPDPEMPEGFEPNTYLRHLAEQGLRDRVKNADDAAWERLNYELGVISKTDYSSYFLLVREFANFTRGEGIMFGVRGSAAGSLVSYTLGVTDVSPLEYDLTFERFLNPERVSMPDVDMDFEDARRDEVIRWVGERYGKDRVSQIVTFGTLGAKAALRDAARVMGFTPQEADRIAKTIPTGPGWSIEKAEKELGDFQTVASEHRYSKLVETAKRIEGLARNQGVHAAGVVIAKDPLENYIPLHRTADGTPVTAYEMGILEKIGLLKMDFLGLSNLTVLARTIENIRKSIGHSSDQLVSDHPVLTGGHGAIPFEDEETFEMLSRGETVGVFQLESGGMRRNIVELKPRSVKELAAMVALYRPGPIEHIPDFVNKKFGRSKITYLDQRMEPILSETYGVIVYQDQVLKLVQALAGFTLGRADLLRRAMGKKDEVQMAAMKPDFVQGCVKNGVDPSVPEKVWKLLEPFAGYAFNKAHAVCYAILAYQTAYLKCHYPVEYMGALLAVYRSKEDRVAAFIEESRRNKILVLPPDINRSEADFTIERSKDKKGIRFGLGAIKGVGDALIRSIVEERRGCPFTHLYEFCERVRPHGLNKGALEALIRAGALDSVDKNRALLLHVMEGALQYADSEQRRKLSGQESLFEEGSDEGAPQYPVLPTNIPMPGRNEILTMEKETMGIYISDHPLRGYERTLGRERTHTCAQVVELDEPTTVTVAGVLAQCNRTTSKAGAPVCRLVIEDFTGQVPGFAFGEFVVKNAHNLVKDSVVRIKGKLKFDDRMGGGGDRRSEINVFEISALEAPKDIDLDDPTLEGTVMVRLGSATLPQLKRLKATIEANPGNYDVFVNFLDSRKQPVVLLNRIDPRPEVLREMKRAVSFCELEVVASQKPVLELADEPSRATDGNMSVVNSG